MAMEIVLQWLDDIDDLVFAGLFKWTLLRSLCLSAALAGAVGTPALVQLGVAPDIVLTLLNVSFAFLIAWAFVGSVSAHVAK